MWNRGIATKDYIDRDSPDGEFWNTVDQVQSSVIILNVFIYGSMILHNTPYVCQLIFENTKLNVYFYITFSNLNPIRQRSYVANTFYNVNIIICTFL